MDTNQTNEHTKSCNCFIRHVCTVRQRALVEADLEYFRSIGDARGATLALAALGKCPSQR